MMRRKQYAVMQQKISLIVQPGDSFFPIVRAVDRAVHTINLTVYRMDDPIIQCALLDARRRGVHWKARTSTNRRLNPRRWRPACMADAREVSGPQPGMPLPAVVTSSSPVTAAVINDCLYSRSSSTPVVSAAWVPRTSA